MLHLIRTKQKSMIVRIIFWVIIAAFVGTVFLVWGRGSDTGPQAGNAALKINDTSVSYDEYQSTYSNLYNLYRSIYSDSFTPQLEKQLNLPQQAIDQLISQTLLAQEAQKSGLEISKDELIKAIAATPAFQENGVFSRDRYLQILAYERMTPEQYEASQRNQLLVEKLRNQLQLGLNVTPEEIETAYREENDKINLNFVRLLPASFENKVEVTSEALKEYFNAHQEEFRQPEKVALRYLKFEATDYAKELTAFTDEELERYYRRNLDQFEIIEQVKAAHILVKVDKAADEATKAERRAFAASLLKQLNEGKDFATLARAYSDDPGSATKGGDLGSFSRGTMVKPFEDAVFAMKPGEISALVETDFGFHIIKLEEYNAPGIKTLAESMEQVKAGLRQEKSRQLAFEKAMDAYNINRKTADLEQAATANNLEVKETGLFGRAEAIDGIGRLEEINAAAFVLAEGELARPVQTATSVFLFALKERQESTIPAFDQIKSAAEEAYRKQQAAELAKTAAEQLLEKTLAAKSLIKSAKAATYQVEETGLFSHSYGAFVPRIGSSQELADAAFALTEAAPLGTQVFKQGETYILISLKQTEKADLEKLDAAEKQKIEDRLLAQKKEAAISETLKTLRDAAQISIDPTLDNQLSRR